MNLAKEENLKNIFKQYAQDNGLIITLHGWLRIVPEEICDKY